jgi:hypothetical protein
VEPINPLGYHRAASSEFDGVNVGHVGMVDGDARVPEIRAREIPARTVRGALNTAPPDFVTHRFVLGVHESKVDHLVVPLVGLDDLETRHCEQAKYT